MTADREGPRLREVRFEPRVDPLRLRVVLEDTDGEQFMLDLTQDQVCSLASEFHRWDIALGKLHEPATIIDWPK